MRRLITPLLALVLAACASTGVQVTPEQASAIKAGVSTESDVRAALGAPTGVSMVSGRRLLIYSGATYAARPASFIPIVGAFAGGADTQTSYVIVTVGADGVVSDVQSHHASSGTATGLAAQPLQQTPGQPR